jgi:hypothetical protein
MRPGLFKLNTPRDLLEKARHDLHRLRDNSADTYAAFDFFVAVSHLPDWLFPEGVDAAKRKAIFDAHVELRIARHIANRGKHFIATHSQNRQIEGTTVMPATRIAKTWDAKLGFLDSETWGPELYVVLDNKGDPATSQFGQRIHALRLAEKILTVAEQIVP